MRCILLSCAGAPVLPSHLQRSMVPGKSGQCHGGRLTRSMSTWAPMTLPVRHFHKEGASAGMSPVSVTRVQTYPVLTTSTDPQPRAHHPIHLYRRLLSLHVQLPVPVTSHDRGRCADTPDVEAHGADEKAAVSVRGVCKCYGATQAVKSVDMQLQLGRITALLGHNGAGKSTLVSVITGVRARAQTPRLLLADCDADDVSTAPRQGAEFMYCQQHSHCREATSRTLRAVTMLESAIVKRTPTQPHRKSCARMRCSGMVHPSAGDCEILGHSVRHDIAAARQSLGICPQQNVLFDMMTVEEHLLLYASIKDGLGASLNGICISELYLVDEPHRLCFPCIDRASFGSQSEH